MRPSCSHSYRLRQAGGGLAGECVVGELSVGMCVSWRTFYDALRDRK